MAKEEFENTNEEGMVEKDLIDHLRDLRSCVIYSIVFILLGMSVAWIYKELLFDLIRQPISPYLKDSGGGLVYTGIMENFVAYLKVSFVGGVIISCPLWIHQIWRFSSPALYRKEKKYAAVFIFAGTFLFIGGVTFAYYIVYPFMFDFLLGFGNGKDQALITVKEYLGFFVQTTMLFGLAFEMPLIITILGMLGIVSAQFLKERRRYAVLFIALISAVLTPPDPLSMLMMMGPLYLLFELSIISVSLLEPKEVL